MREGVQHLGTVFLVLQTHSGKWCQMSAKLRPMGGDQVVRSVQPVDAWF